MVEYLLAVGVIAAIYLLLTLGLNLQYGLTGLVNFGHVGFFAVGAYVSTLMTMGGVGMAVGFVAAMVVAALLALPVGLLSLRLRIDYFAIVTLAFSEAVRLVITNEQWLTGGVQGIAGIPSLASGLGYSQGASAVTFACLVVANLLAVLAIRRMVASPYGRLIQAIRDDEDAVTALGKAPGRYKVEIFMIGAALAGLAGAFYAHYITYIAPDQFLPLVTFYVWVAMILGGAGSIAGSVIGAIVLMLFLEGSRFLRDVVPDVSEVAMAAVRIGVVGLALVTLMIKRPGGIMGDYSSK